MEKGKGVFHSTKEEKRAEGQWGGRNELPKGGKGPPHRNNGPECNLTGKIDSERNRKGKKD